MKNGQDILIGMGSITGNWEILIWEILNTYMNYQKHYNILMERSPKTKIKGVYLERHRILPGCMGGKYVIGNIAYLTPEEHYLAHMLLVKIYPNNIKIIYAANRMRTLNNKQYGWLRKYHSPLVSEQNRNRVWTDKSKEKLSKSKIGAKGREFTNEEKESYSNRMTQTNPMFNAEYRQRMGDTKKGNTNVKGRLWITNGMQRKRILPDTPIPLGYRLGY
jgi:hypothetical protein